MKKEEDKPLFDVQQLGRVTMYEAAKGVDWMSQFPDEPGCAPAKLIDLPAEQELLPPPPAPSPEPLLRPTSPPPAQAHAHGAVPSISPPALRSVAVLYPPGRARTPRAAIAASITTVIGTVAFLYWLVSPPVVNTSAALSEPQNAVHADRLTMDALRPAEETAPSPTAAAPEPSTLPEPTQAPAAANVRQNARTGDLARDRKGTAALTSPKPTARKPTPTPTPTPAIASRATPTPASRQPLSASSVPALAIQPTLGVSPPPMLPSPSPAALLTPSPSPSAPPLPVTVVAPPPRVVATPQPSSTPLPTPTPTPAAPAASPAPAASAAATAAADRAAVRTALDRYRTAFESLRSESVQAVWPGANTRSLARAFEQLQSQSVEFYSCGIELAAASAEATCTGSVTFVPKVGGKTPRVESRQWSFYLKRQNDRWIIDRVVAK